MNNTNYQICKKLVMDSSDPSIKFDDNGICTYYHDFKKNIMPNWHPNQLGQKRLEKIIHHIKSSQKDKEFNCILGLSGGLDSSFLLHKMVKDFGLKPLVFHVDAGWNSDIAVRNINSLVSKLNLELYTEVLDWAEIKEFQLALFKSGVPHLDIPQDHAFVSVLYKFAKKYDIKYILNGGNIATEAVSPPLELLYWGTDLTHIKDILKQHGNSSLKNYPFSSAISHKLFLRLFRGIKVIKPLNYLNYNKNNVIEELSKEYGWIDYGQKHFESRFTRFFEGYWLPTRFNFDMRRPQFSSLILSGQMTRGEALEKLENSPIEPETVKKEFQFIASKLDISTDDLERFHQLPLKFYWDYKNESKFFSLGESLMSVFFKTRRGGAF